MKKLIEVLKAVLNRFRPGIGHNRSKRPSPVRETRQDAEEAGRWFHLQDLLGQLDDYFPLVEAVREDDPEAYKMLQEVGASIAHQGHLMDVKALPEYWRDEGSPTFGASAMHGGGPSVAEMESGERTTAAFFYFRKEETPPLTVQKAAGETFWCGLVHVAADTRKRRRRDLCSLTSWFYVAVDDEGGIQLLKVREKTVQKLKKGGSINHTKWRYPPRLEGIFHENLLVSGSELHFETIGEYAAWIFKLAARGAATRESGTVVRVKRGDAVASFTIPVERTPYFFKDRELRIGDTGHRKKVVHIVRAHKRELPDGRETFVRSHFRGERQFEWNGYEVSVSMPGWHHNPLEALTPSVEYFDEGDEVPGGLIEVSDLMPRINRHLDGKDVRRVDINRRTAS